MTIGELLDLTIRERSEAGKNTPLVVLECIEELRKYFSGEIGQKEVDNEQWLTLLRAAIVCAEV